MASKHEIGLSYDRSLGRMTIVHGAHEVTIWHSTVLSRDALPALAEAVVAAWKLGEGRCSWLDEPGESRWVLERRGDGLRVTVLRFRDSSPRQADAQGRVEFSTDGKFRRFAVQVKNVLQVEVDAGIYGDDPPSAYHKLDALLHSTRSPDRPLC